MKGAIPIYVANQNIDLDSKAQQVFNENFDAIIDATKQIVELESNIFSGVKVLALKIMKFYLIKLNLKGELIKKMVKDLVPFGMEILMRNNTRSKYIS